jgi:hypothetical protein
VISLPAALAAGVAIGILQATFFEWAYHRYWLHRPWLPPQMFTAHTLVHHQLCKHDDTYHVHDEEQEEALTFQWWGGPVLIGINALPWLAAWWALGARVSGLHPGTVITTLAGTIFVYYLAYEGFHYLMHKPKIGWIQRSPIFRFMDHHHRIHHSHMGRNFNVILPLADLVMGTLMLRDPLAPRVTEPTARRTARRHSRYGQRLRESGVEAPIATEHASRERETAESGSER